MESSERSRLIGASLVGKGLLARDAKLTVAAYKTTVGFALKPSICVVKIVHKQEVARCYVSEDVLS